MLFYENGRFPKATGRVFMHPILREVYMRSGLDTFCETFSKSIGKKKIGLLCHAASVTAEYVHAVDALAKRCTLSALFGPQHGLFGQTQDNMIEWEGARHPTLGVPVFSLYGKKRKPTPAMLEWCDLLIVDLQDVGARPYTYIWTVKRCMEACMEAGTPMIICDRPNPIGCIGFDGPILDDALHTFVGGAPIPLCHRMTLGEMALFMQRSYFTDLDLQVVPVSGWNRDTVFSASPPYWVLPSPNMSTAETALVYPGQVLLEATTLSEGRGTTRPFEFFGAPWLDHQAVMRYFNESRCPGCFLRVHDYIPTFHKFTGEYCHGFQLHVTDRSRFMPVYTTCALIRACIATSGGAFAFSAPPYEYEFEKSPFDILIGNESVRPLLESGASIEELPELWREERREFVERLNECTLYGKVEW